MAGEVLCAENRIETDGVHVGHFNKLGSVAPALVRDQVELETFGRPERHHHDAGVHSRDKSVLGRQNPLMPIDGRRGGKVHLRSVPEAHTAPAFAFPGNGRFGSGLWGGRPAREHNRDGRALEFVHFCKRQDAPTA
jgi:hypothetical protein